MTVIKYSLCNGPSNGKVYGLLKKKCCSHQHSEYVNCELFIVQRNVLEMNMTDW